MKNIVRKQSCEHRLVPRLFLSEGPLQVWFGKQEALTLRTRLHACASVGREAALRAVQLREDGVLPLGAAAAAGADQPRVALLRAAPRAANNVKPCRIWSVKSNQKWNRIHPCYNTHAF